MSKQIDYSQPLRGFEQQPDAAVNEINGLRFTLRRVIEQRDHWMLRYAEVTQQLDMARDRELRQAQVFDFEVACLKQQLDEERRKKAEESA